MIRRRAFLRASTGLAAAGGAVALAACGADTGAGQSPASQRVTIRAGIRTSYDPEGWKKVSEDEQAKVSVDTELIDSDTAPYGRKILALAAADSLPDVVYVHPNFFSSVSSRKMLIDHERLAAQHKFDLKGIQKELVDSNRWTDGKLYAIPYSGVSYLVIVNLALFKQRSVTPPLELDKQKKWNWEGFRDALKRLTTRANPEQPIVGMPEHARGLQYLSHWIFGNGGEVFSKDMKSCLLDTPKTREALEYVAALHGRDQVTPQQGEAPLFNHTSLQQGFTQSGRIGLWFRATTEVNQAKPLADRGVELGIAPVPAGPVVRTPRGAGNAWAITSSSKQPDAGFRGISAWHRDPVLDHLYRQRFMFPARQSQFEHPAFKASLLPWDDLDVERNALKDVRIMATPDRFTEIDEQWNRMWVDALYSKRTVRDLLQEFIPFANNLLRG